MKPHRVTIKYKNGEQTCVISTTVPSKDGWDAISKVISANNIEDANVLSVKAELLKID